MNIYKWIIFIDTTGLQTGIVSPAESYILDCLSAADLDNHLIIIQYKNAFTQIYILDIQNLSNSLNFYEGQTQ